MAASFVCEKQKEVKTSSLSPPGVGGVLHNKAFGGTADLPCQAGLRPHSRLLLQFVRRLTTKELVFLRFVTLRNARVNGKNKEIPSGETNRRTFSPAAYKVSEGP
jgi:hypothetical protein